MQIQISWLLKKPTDLDLHCLKRHDTADFSRTRVNVTYRLPSGHMTFIRYINVDATMYRRFVTLHCIDVDATLSWHCIDVDVTLLQCCVPASRALILITIQGQDFIDAILPPITRNNVDLSLRPFWMPQLVRSAWKCCHHFLYVRLYCANPLGSSNLGIEPLWPVVVFSVGCTWVLCPVCGW